MKPKLRHVGIVVNDICAMVVYYQNLGFKLSYWNSETWDQNSIIVAKLKDSNGGIIELITQPWPSHIALTVDKLPSGQPIKRDNVHVIFKQDPEGNWIEFVKEL